MRIPAIQKNWNKFATSDKTKYRELMSPNDRASSDEQAPSVAHPELASWAWDAESDTITCSKTLYRIFGLSDEEQPPHYKDHLQLYTQKSAEKLDAAFTRCLQTGMPYALDLEGLHTSGKMIYVRVYGEAKRDENGRITKLFGQLIDLTPQETNRRELEYKHQLFRTSFEHALVGKALISLEGEYLDVNPALIAMFGYSIEELKKLKWQGITHPEDLKKDLISVSKLLSGEISNFSMEKRYYHKSGSLVWGLLSVSLAKDEKGHPLHFISQIQDITRKHASEENERLSSATLSSISQGVLIADAHRLIRLLA